jgi:hypothetical protein
MDISTILALAGLGVTVIALVLPYTRVNPPTWAISGGLIVGLIFLAVAALQIWNKIGAPPTAWPTAFVYVAVVGALILASQRYGQYFLQRPQATVHVEDPNSSQRTAEQILTFIAGIKDLSGKIPIKIVSIDEWVPFATMLAQAFKLARYEVMVNERNSTWVFPAEFRHNKVILRSRPLHIGVSFIIAVGLLQIAALETLDFPDTDAHNFIQIEVGGSPY